jgi:ApbE superfamily uncharacterized protein (UPF0280 family)
MREPAIVRLLPDGRRLHLQDGPIDLIVGADGGAGEIRKAYEAAAKRFVTILDELCEELPLLRAGASRSAEMLHGIVARRMTAAVARYAKHCFITPMAAVAGAVAEEVLGAMTAVAELKRAYVNNGGDIALHLAPGESFRIGMVERPDHVSLFGAATIKASQPVRGIATSGWRGRSFSLGIADAVTILADRAAMADAAATVVANAVDLPGHAAITRIAAREIAPDNDLGQRFVTRGVGELASEEIERALNSGTVVARELLSQGHIQAAALHLQGCTRVVTGRNKFEIPTPLEFAKLIRSVVHA